MVGENTNMMSFGQNLYPKNNNCMKLSIVTISYNNFYGLKSTAASVFSQTWKDFEWIVIDGGSTDGTKEYIESLERKPDFWCSEKMQEYILLKTKELEYLRGNMFVV